MKSIDLRFVGLGELADGGIFGGTDLIGGVADGNLGQICIILNFNIDVLHDVF